MLIGHLWEFVGKSKEQLQRLSEGDVLLSVLMTVLGSPILRGLHWYA